MKRFFELINKWVPVLLLFWIITCLVMDDYQEAAYAVAVLGVIMISDQLSNINDNLSRISDNTDLTSKNIVVKQNYIPFKRDEESE